MHAVCPVCLPGLWSVIMFLDTIFKLFEWANKKIMYFCETEVTKRV